MGMRTFVVATATGVALAIGLLPVASFAGIRSTDTVSETHTKAPLVSSESEFDKASGETSKRSRPRPKVAKNEWEGFLSCSARRPGSFGIANCAPWDVAGVLGPHESQHVTEAKPGLKTIVVAMEWEPSEHSLQPYLQHDIFVNIPNEEVTGQNSTFREEAAEPGLEYRLDVDPSNPMLDWDNAKGSIPIEFRISAGSDGDTNVVIQQPFTVHYHLFYGKRAPKKYSALP